MCLATLHLMQFRFGSLSVDLTLVHCGPNHNPTRFHLTEQCEMTEKCNTTATDFLINKIASSFLHLISGSASAKEAPKMGPGSQIPSPTNQVEKLYES